MKRLSTFVLAGLLSFSAMAEIQVETETLKLVLQAASRARTVQQYQQLLVREGISAANYRAGAVIGGSEVGFDAIYNLMQTEAAKTRASKLGLEEFAVALTETVEVGNLVAAINNRQIGDLGLVTADAQLSANAGSLSQVEFSENELLAAASKLRLPDAKAQGILSDAIENYGLNDAADAWKDSLVTFMGYLALGHADAVAANGARCSIAKVDTGMEICELGEKAMADLVTQKALHTTLIGKTYNAFISGKDYVGKKIKVVQGFGKMVLDLLKNPNHYAGTAFEECARPGFSS